MKRQLSFCIHLIEAVTKFAGMRFAMKAYRRFQDALRFMSIRKKLVQVMIMDTIKPAIDDIQEVERYQSGVWDQIAYPK